MMDANGEEERRVQEKISSEIGFKQNMTYSSACLQRNYTLKTFRIRYKDKVLNQFVAYF
jgi:hypothetical protein